MEIPQGSGRYDHVELTLPSADLRPDDRAAEARRADDDVPRWLARGAGWSWRLLIVVAAGVVVLYAVSHLLVVVVPVVGALFGAAILSPPARWVRDRGLPPLLATWVVFLVAIAFGAALAWWLVPSVGSELGNLRGALVHGLDQVRAWLTGPPLHLSATQVDATVARIRAQASASNAVLLHGALAGALLALEIAASILLTIVLTFFFVKDGGSLATWLGGFAEPSRRDRMQGAAALAWQTFSAYVQGTAINGLVNGTLMGLGLTAIGVPLAVPIAVITFFGGFFPLVGGLISGGIAVLVALASTGIRGAILVLALTTLIHHVEGYVVGPFVLGRKVRLPAVVIVLALSIGTVIGGVFGAFVAVPVTAIALALVEFYRGLPVEIVATTDQGRSLPRARLAVVRWVSNRREEGGDRSGAVPISAEDPLEPGPEPADPAANVGP